MNVARLFQFLFCIIASTIIISSSALAVNLCSDNFSPKNSLLKSPFIKMVNQGAWKYANGVYGPSSMMTVALFRSLNSPDREFYKSLIDHSINENDHGFLAFMRAMARGHKASKVSDDSMEKLLDNPRVEIYRAIHQAVALRPTITLLELINFFDELTEPVHGVSANGSPTWYRASKNFYPLYKNYINDHGPLHNPEDWHHFLGFVFSAPEMSQSIKHLGIFIENWSGELTSEEFMSQVDQLRIELLAELKSRQPGQSAGQSSQGESLNTLISEVTAKHLAKYRSQFSESRFSEQDVGDIKQAKFPAQRLLRIDFYDPDSSAQNILSDAFFAETRYDELNDRAQ